MIFYKLEMDAYAIGYFIDFDDDCYPLTSFEATMHLRGIK